MIADKLIGRRVRVLAWYDHAPLIAARPKGEFVGTIIRTQHATDGISISVLLDRLHGEFTFPLSDVELLS